MNNNDFRTFSEYMKNDENILTASMEDYLEMIYRLSMNTGFTRVHELSKALNVHPPSATRMVQKLGELDLLQYEKYGVIILKESGRKLGELLLKRHYIIESFLRLLGIPEDKILKETEKVEHTISDETTKCFEKYIYFIKDNPDVARRFNAYRK
ncbi:transcriptional regulator MntR [Clostridium homopropionicum DSM 5847]|uniref:Manganese transport regulator n=1 Tax=Clostridium homopropionicum DSM 5847 TaxID=1121318 RepID=A0A0L6ZEN6_9CLOT|nr:iron dependent repressor, metal binding and dimerization domain protein [Clostridium homopropionicum]KOA21440.1 transcriptional regulator MntR [Clostridium homopropionicum DSM 5847]SFG09790.1 iron (metal) dependent repressor, DtxR family [Clostridium homopropionicum]